MDIPVYRLIDLARLLFFRALLLEAERRRDVSPSTSAHDTLQTARTHRRRAARRGRGVRPTGTPLSAHGFDSRQRAVDLRPMPDLCGQRARRGRLFAFDANGELIEAPTPAGDVPFSRRAARSSRGVADFSRGAVPCAERPVPSTAEDLDASMRAVPSSERPMPSALLDPLFPERPMPSAAGDVHAAVRDVPSPAEDLPFAKRAARSSRGAVHAAPFDTLFPERPMPSAAGDVPSAAGDVPSAAWDVHAAVRDVLAPAEDVPSLERDARSSRRALPSAAEDVHAAVRDRGDSSEARYAALAKRSAQTADRLLRRVSRHRAQGK